jgi:hypothetical protein
MHQFGSGKGGVFIARHYSTQLIPAENVAIFDEEQFMGQVFWYRRRPAPPKYGSWFTGPDLGHGRFGFSYFSGQNQVREFTTSSRVLVFPWAAPVLLFGVFPLFHLRVYRKSRLRFRLSNNLCAACGYDLRGGLEKCPECGTVRISAVP